MTRLPVTKPPRRLHPAPDADLWDDYEAANRRAADLYRTMPLAAGKASLGTLVTARRCTGCRRSTRAYGGTCGRCRRTTLRGGA
jgi:hypothetical protein